MRDARGQHNNNLYNQDEFVQNLPVGLAHNHPIFRIKFREFVRFKPQYLNDLNAFFLLGVAGAVRLVSQLLTILCPVSLSALYLRFQ